MLHKKAGFKYGSRPTKKPSLRGVYNKGHSIDNFTEVPDS
jgi:hypothetical protein